MKIFLMLFLVLSLNPVSWAGSKADQKARIAPEKIVRFAKDAEKYAASQGARAFIIARVGRPEEDLPKGIRYTHTAVAIYSSIELADGEIVRGYAIHNLYQNADQPDRSQLVTDYPVDFFWGAQSLKAGIIIPEVEVQQRLIELISTGKNKRLHNPRYSVVANPFNSEYQNCTEHTLDMLNAAIYQTMDMAQIKANTKAHFSGQRVRTSRFKLMLGSLLMDDLTTEDHSGKIYTTTFGAIHRYLQQYGLVRHAVEFYPAGNTVEL